MSKCLAQVPVSLSPTSFVLIYFLLSIFYNLTNREQRTSLMYLGVNILMRFHPSFHPVIHCSLCRTSLWRMRSALRPQGGAGAASYSGDAAGLGAWGWAEVPEPVGASISGKVEVISKQNQEESEAVAGVEVITSSLESGDE